MYNIQLVYHRVKGMPVVTVARVSNDQNTHVGIGMAICSEDDLCLRKRGNRIAIGRAIKAIQTQQSNSIVKRDKIVQLLRQFQLIDPTSVRAYKQVFLERG